MAAAERAASRDHHTLHDLVRVLLASLGPVIFGQDHVIREMQLQTNRTFRAAEAKPAKSGRNVVGITR